MKKNNLSDAEFKTRHIRLHKECSEDRNSIKNIQSEMKDTLLVIKNDLQRINSKMHHKNQISNLEHKESKNNQNSKKTKKESPPTPRK